MREPTIRRRPLLRAAGAGVVGVTTIPAVLADSDREPLADGDPSLVSASVRHVGGTEPDMSRITADVDVRQTAIGVVLIDEDATDTRARNLTAAGADDSTIFEVELVVESLDPRYLTGHCRGLRWERAFHDDETATLTIHARPTTYQRRFDSLSIEEWVEQGQGPADMAIDRNVSFSISELPGQTAEIRAWLDGSVVGSNAQYTAAPVLDPHENIRSVVDVTLAAPSETVDGDEHEVFCYVVAGPALLEAWNLADPGELVAWNHAGETDFTVQWDDDALVVDVDVGYPGTPTTVTLGPATPRLDPIFVSSTLRHVDGTEPDMDNVWVHPKDHGDTLMIHVDAFDWARREEAAEPVPLSAMQTGDLAPVGVDESTTFEIDLTLDRSNPRLLVGRCRGLRWERHERDDGTVDVTVTAQPAENQLISEDYLLEDWPTGEDDRADRKIDASVSFSIAHLEEFPDEHADRVNGTVIGSNAQHIGTPSLRTDDEGRERLTITTAAPHYTVDGDVYDGFYYAVLSPSLLDAWDVDGPDELATWYDGDEADFEASWLGEAILIEVDVQFSVATIEVGHADAPERDDPPDDDPSDNGDGADSDGDDAPADTADDPSDHDDDGDTPPEEEGPNDEELPGFGMLGAIGGLAGAASILWHRFRANEEP